MALDNQVVNAELPDPLGGQVAPVTTFNAPQQTTPLRQFDAGVSPTAYTPTSFQAPPAPTMPTASTYLTPETKVASQLSNLLSRQSPLMQLASTRAKEQANSLGLLSSSMAVGAGQREATKQMLPIAQADATTAAQFGHQQQQAEAQAQLTAQQGLLSGALESQKSANQAQMYGVQGEISSQLNQQDFGYKQQLQVMDQDFKNTIATMDITNKERVSLATNANELARIAMTEITNIQRDPSIKTAEDRANAITSVNNIYAANVNSLSSIYGVSVSWDALIPAGSPVANPTTPVAPVVNIPVVPLSYADQKARDIQQYGTYDASTV